MPLTQVQSGLLESGAALNNIGAGNITPAFLNTQAQYTGFKNRLINGNMTISQRNGTSSVTPTDGQYTLDRWVTYLTQTSKFTVQQDAGAVTPPAGFTDYLGVTSTSAYSVVSGDVFLLSQIIEGFNIADLGWGTASASPVTLSFWVRSSLTGTFGGSIRNAAGNQNYPFSYTVSSANTWTSISVTIPAPTTGSSWNTTNGQGMFVVFSLGSGSTFSGTANAWSSSNFYSVTGATSVVGTNGATFYITGVQLEKGSTATSFDYRPYGTELALCRRYFARYFQNTNGIAGDSAVFNMANWNGTEAYGANWFQVSMRAAPSFSFSSLTDFTWYASSATRIPTAIDQQGASVDRCEMKIQWSSSISTGTAGWLRIGGSANNGWIQWSAEL